MIDPRLQEISDKIVQMRQFSKETGIHTSRSQGALIRDLNPIDMSVVAAEVNRQLFNLTEESR